MIDFPKPQFPQYLKLLENSGVPAASFAECIKWSRYFLDYCSKYSVLDSDFERVSLFVDTLKSRMQSELQCRQAAKVGTVFIEVQKNEESVKQSSEIADHKSLFCL